MIHWHLNQVDQVSFYYDCAIVTYTLKWQLSAGHHKVLVQGMSPYIVTEQLHYELLVGQYVEQISGHLLYQEDPAQQTVQHSQKQQAYQQWQTALNQCTFLRSTEERLKKQLQHWISLIEKGEMNADEWRRGFLKLDQEVQNCITQRFKAEQIEKESKLAYQNYDCSPTKNSYVEIPQMLFHVSLQQAEHIEVILRYPVENALWRPRHHLYIHTLNDMPMMSEDTPSIPQQQMMLNWHFYACIWQHSRENWKRAECQFFPYRYLVKSDDQRSLDAIECALHPSFPSYLVFDKDQRLPVCDLAKFTHIHQQHHFSKKQLQQDLQLVKDLRFMSPHSEHYPSQEEMQSLLLHQEDLRTELLMYAHLNQAQAYWVLEGEFNTLMPFLSAPSAVYLLDTYLGVYFQPSINLDQSFKRKIGYQKDVLIQIVQRDLNQQSPHEDDFEVDLHFKIYNLTRASLYIQLQETLEFNNTSQIHESLDIDISFAQQNLFDLSGQLLPTEIEQALTWSWNAKQNILYRWLYLPAHSYSEEILNYQFKKITKEINGA